MKYKSCHLLEHGIYFFYDSIQVCCFIVGKEAEHFYLQENYSGEEIDWDKILEQKRILRKNHKEGKIHPNCQNCFNLEEKEWDENPSINNIYISHWTNCNCTCSYCYTECSKEYYNTRKNYKIMPILKQMLEKGILNFDGYLAFGGGEPGVLEEFDDIVNLFLDNNVRSIVTNSSGIKYVESIGKGLSTGRLDVTVSIDSGSPETFKKIKKMDLYSKVIENLKKYIKDQGEYTDKVRSKYVIVPEVNDNTEEIEKWLQTSINTGIKQVIIDLEGKWYLKIRENIPNHVFELISYVEKRTNELGLGLSYYSYADQLRHQRDNKLLS